MTNIFSPRYPTLRLVWDSTSLDAFMRDPLSYYWKYVLGHRSRDKSVDLLWGTAWDKAVGRYHWCRKYFDSRQRALHETIEWAIDHAERVELDQAAADSGQKARKKNTSTLIRSLVWYDEEHGDYDLYEPLTAEPTMVSQPLGFSAPCGNEYIMVGNRDQIVRERETGKKLVAERKSTVSTISPAYWLRYDPSVQINVYDWLGHKNGQTEGVFIEACQTAVGFTRFAHHEVYRTNLQRIHWESVMRFWIKFAEYIAIEDRWKAAMNLASQRWESTTRNIQRRTPAVWEGMLNVELERREPWNPLEINTP